MTNLDQAAISAGEQPFTQEERDFIAQKVEEASAKLKKAHAEIAKEVWGQDKIIKDTITCMVAGGHLLAVGAPGLAKTLMVSRVAHVMGLDFKRTQFTPDLMPSDILGSEILDEDEAGKKMFRFEKGPLFTQFFMADEINRAGPRTQAALLEAMQEKKITVGGTTYELQRPFSVMATQNPIEQEGTYPLPEAQLDRFLMKLDFDYPDRESETKILNQTTGTSENIMALYARHASGDDLTNPEIYKDQDTQNPLKQILDRNDLVLMQKLAMKLPLSKEVEDAIIQIVRSARPNTSDAIDEVNKYIQPNGGGPSPRATQAFAKAVKARALFDGRLAPDVEDVLALVEPILSHRLILNAYSRSDDITFKDIHKALVQKI